MLLIGRADQKYLGVMLESTKCRQCVKHGDFKKQGQTLFSVS